MPPCCGSCSILPLEGTAIQTTFTVNCSGWQVHQGTPIFHVKRVRGSDYTLLNYGVSALSTIIIAEGEKVNDYNVSIVVEINDLYDASTKVELPIVKV